MGSWNGLFRCWPEGRTDNLTNGAKAMEFDLLIKNGTVIDGTGSAGRLNDIGVVGDKIKAVGDLQGSNAGRVIDATGKVVCPGFIDVHVHSELALLGGMDQYAPLKMGVTTQLSSPDGFSWAPLCQTKLIEMKQYLQVFYNEDVLGEAEDMSIEVFLSQFNGTLPANIALQVPHASIRLAVLGWDNRPATDQEISEMERLVRDWLEYGAVAFATGLEYEPMRHADLRELVRLAKIVSDYGGIYVAHQRGYGKNVKIGCHETFTIGELAEIPVHISHFTVDDDAEMMLEVGVQRGIDVTFDMYPYPAGCTHLLMALPESIQVGPPHAVIERLHDRTLRAQIAQHVAKTLLPDRVKFAAVGSMEPLRWEGKSLQEVCNELDMPLSDAICEILLRTNLQALMIYHWPEDRHQYLERTFKHPLHMVSTDGVYVGQRPHPRGFGTYPQVLREFVINKAWLNMETAIYKMSGFPAERFNIKKRGVLVEGNYADIVIFDPAKIMDMATFDAPRQDPIGIEYVFVNGQPVLSEGMIQPGLFGRVLR